MCNSRKRRLSTGFTTLLGLLPVALLSMACDGPQAAADVTTPQTEKTVAVSLRIDSSAEVPASLTVLAFRAAYAGVTSGDVLGLVDPLVSAVPERGCAVRDFGRVSADLETRGSSIELEELTGVAVAVGAGSSTAPAMVRPSARLYPDVTSAISGVVAEAGPVALSTLPQRVRVTTTDATAGGTAGTAASSDDVDVDVPAAARLILLNGTSPKTGARVESSADLVLGVSGLESASLELRPLGATVVLVCPLRPAATAATTTAASPSTTQTAIVARQALAVLLSQTGAPAGAPVAATLDLVRRSEGRLATSGGRVSVESRTSTLVELRP